MESTRDTFFSMFSQFLREKSLSVLSPRLEGVTMASRDRVSFNFQLRSIMAICPGSSFSRGIRILKFQDHLDHSWVFGLTKHEKSRNFRQYIERIFSTSRFTDSLAYRDNNRLKDTYNHQIRKPKSLFERMF